MGCGVSKKRYRPQQGGSTESNGSSGTEGLVSRRFVKKIQESPESTPMGTKRKLALIKAHGKNPNGIALISDQDGLVKKSLDSETTGWTNGKKSSGESSRVAMKPIIPGFTGIVDDPLRKLSSRDQEDDLDITAIRDRDKDSTSETASHKYDPMVFQKHFSMEHQIQYANSLFNDKQQEAEGLDLQQFGEYLNSIFSTFQWDTSITDNPQVLTKSFEEMKTSKTNLVEWSTMEMFLLEVNQADKESAQN
mmetsp:Transcript_15873/g.17718  ORF Transcript_15873/g.17718 Transcript_15873/m.17718 type:complete len:249 (+) Transcript_15873:32-778(+)